MTLRTRLRLIGLAYIAILIGSALIIGAQINQRAREEAALRALRVANERVTRIESAYLDQETGQRGYVITGDARFLEPYSNGKREAARLLKELGTLPDRDASLGPPLRLVERRASVWQVQSAEAEIAARRAGEIGRVEELQRAGVGRVRFNALRTALDDLQARVATSVRDGLVRYDAKKHLILWMQVGAVLLALVATGMIAWIIRRDVLRPVNSLVGSVRRVRSDDLDTPVPAVGPPELAELGAAVDEMRQRLWNQIVAVESAKQVLEDDATVLVQLSNELASRVGDFPAGWTVAAGLEPAEGIVAGDCYDVSLVSPTRIALVVLDVSGHGASAGMTALMTMKILHGAIATNTPPGIAVAAVARDLADSDLFLTGFVATIDTETGECRYANAGHPPPLVWAADGTHRSLEPTGPLVGPMQVAWGTETVTIGHGGKLVVCTDGLLEARRADGAFFGDERLLDALAEVQGEEADAVKRRILETVREFTAARFRDDLTVAILCRS